MEIQEKLQILNQKISNAAVKSGRTLEDVTLIAVSKMHSVDEINLVRACGINNFGENKVQELVSKYDFVDKNVNWHLIGHLQTNKVKQIVDKVTLIHSVDSIHLAKEIDKRCKEINKTMDILIQVNAANEQSKFGIPCNEVLNLADEIKSSCSNIRIRGLMQIAPAAENPEDVRQYFKDVKNIYDKMPYADILSMGMSGDYEIAIEEGANMIRIGTFIFGERNYNYGTERKI